MSLITAVNVPEGMVFAADRRITQAYPNGVVSYIDNTDKIIPCGNNVVLFCGDYYIGNSRKTVLSFTKRFCKKHETEPVCVLASELLRESVDAGIQDVMFLVAGYYSQICYVYQISCLQQNIVLPISGDQFGAVYCGQNDIFHSICRDVSFEDAELSTAIQLSEFGVNATIEAYKFKRDQCVGGHADVYVLPSMNSPYWYIHNK